MTGRSGLAAALIATAAVWLGAQQKPAPPSSGQTFRTGTDVVMVDVSVRRGNTPVTGLAAADFELRDNGVRQEIDTVETKAVPIDLSVVVDVSGNPERPWEKPTPRSAVAADADAKVRRLTQLLRAGDRVRLFAIDTALQPVWPLQPAGAPPAIASLEYDGQSSLYNTLATVLLQPVEPTRRHVVVVSTKGLDTVSSITAAGVRAIAERSDAQLHLVMEERKADEEQEMHNFQCTGGAGFVGIEGGQEGGMGLCWPTTRFWVPARRRLFQVCGLTPGCLHRLTPDGLQLQAGAEATGGGLYQSQAFSEPTLLSVFAEAFENFRQSYVLRYTSRGVTREGWHQITVMVPRDRSLRIEARRGYAVDLPPPPPPPAPAPVTNASVLRTLPDLLTAYDRAAYDAVALNLRQVLDPERLIQDFDRGGNPWPASPRREAVFALELAEAGVYSARPPARDEGAKLLQRFAQLVRDPLEPDAFERAWLLAAVTMLQGTIRPDLIQPFVDGALARFPTEPRFVLARAIATDQRWRGGMSVTADLRAVAASAPADHTEAVVAQYTAAAAIHEVRTEALIRLGWFQHRIGRNDDATATLRAAAASETTDGALLYLRELLLGQVLVAVDRNDEAVTHFERALGLAPGMQSARVALMNGLLIRGDRDAADKLADDLQASPATLVDPWWMYWQGDYRRYPQALARARELIR